MITLSSSLYLLQARTLRAGREQRGDGGKIGLDLLFAKHHLCFFCFAQIECLHEVFTELKALYTLLRKD